MKIAITGTIGSGKSRVSDILRSHAFTVYDADVIAHDLYKPGEPIYDYLRTRYGKTILNEDRTINRQILAKYLFESDENIMDLEDKIFPEVMEQINRYHEEDTHQIMFFEVSMLFEAELEQQFDEVWVIDVDDEVRHKRLFERGLTLEKIKEREARQIPTATKVKLADCVIDNNGTHFDLEQQILHEIERVSE